MGRHEMRLKMWKPEVLDKDNLTLVKRTKTVIKLTPTREKEKERKLLIDEFSKYKLLEPISPDKTPS